MSTSMPEPSGFRTVHLCNEVKAGVLAHKLVKEHITFNYSVMDGIHQFVYPVKHDKRIKELAELLK